ncbi:MAG: DUF4910 domain-containing protein [Candidatus Omnitrophota bacterium]
MSEQKVLENYFDRLWPICRSIMGAGYRESLAILSEWVPYQRLKFCTGSKVLDWTVPQEWIVRDAYFIDPLGKKHANFKMNNLHLINYSMRFSGNLSLHELRKHLHSLPDQPQAIPYLTSYYEPRWGFCISHDELRSLPEGMYQIVVDTDFKPGHIEIGEAVLPGNSLKEVFFSTYLCHPSMANNELSGPLVMSLLYQKIAQLPKRRFSYRFVVLPETIGAICYLKKRGAHCKRNMAAGFQVTCVGGRGGFTYKRSRRGDTLADRAAELVLRSKPGAQVIPFSPADGSDERQYCSPGFDLPVGSLMRMPYGKYPEYHTSLDNKSCVSFASLAESAETYLEIVNAIENNFTWKNRVMFGEPQLGKRGLYRSLSTKASFDDSEAALWWLLNLADGTQDLLAIAERSKIQPNTLMSVASTLETAGLLQKVK